MTVPATWSWRSRRWKESGMANGWLSHATVPRRSTFSTSRCVHRADHTPDPVLAVLDIHMPKVSGLEVLITVRRDEALRQLPVIMLTGSREESDLVRSRELGVDAFVVKPLGFREFFEAVQDLGSRWAVLSPHGTPESGAAMLAGLTA